MSNKPLKINNLSEITHTGIYHSKNLKGLPSDRDDGCYIKAIHFKKLDMLGNERSQEVIFYPSYKRIERFFRNGGWTDWSDLEKLDENK